MEDENTARCKDLNTKERSMSKSQFSTFGVPNGTLKGPNFPLLGFGPMAFG